MNIKKLQYIDAARGIAILMVIMVHTAQTVKGISPQLSAFAQYGQMGVQLFFLASAYTLCRAFAQRRDESLPITKFFIRRFFRIAPLYYLGIVFYGIFYITCRAFEMPNAMALGPYSIKNIIANALFIHGFVISANNNVVPGGWSIGTEMAFYIAFPLLFFIFAKFRDLSRFFIMIPVVVAIFTSYFFATVIANFEQGVVYRDFFSNNLINQLPVFLIGMASFFLKDANGSNPNWIKSGALQALGFLAFTVIAFVFWNDIPNVMYAIKPIITGISFFFLLNLLRAWPNPFGIICLIGRVSFSMYMFHTLFAKFLLSQAIAKIALPFSPDLIFVCSFFGICVLTLLIAMITERTIEKPGIKFGNTIISRLRSRDVL